ncbi:MAG: ethylbenzene dehydrogenase-related protein [Bacillota bacterium]
MRSVKFAILALMIWAFGMAAANAFPSYNASCAVCHSGEQVGKPGAPKLVLGDSNSPALSQKTAANTLKALKVDIEPIKESKAVETVWSKAPALQVPTYWISPNAPKDPASATPTITLKSVFNDQKLYILAQWADPKPDLLKDSWEYKNGSWVRDGKKYDEDRLSFQWNINTAGFDQTGCAMTCHSYTKDFGKYTNKPGETTDLWHWKSTRSHPLNWTDDGFVQYVAPEEAGNKRGRSADRGKNGEIRNEQTVTIGETKVTMPKYMFNPNLGITDKTFLFASQAVELDMSAIKEGDVLPGFVITDANQLGIPTGPEGSRGDVQTFAEWANGKWTLVMTRDLDTKNPDDAVFEVGKPKAFGVAVFNNNTSFNHAVSNVLYLDLVEERTPQAEQPKKEEKVAKAEYDGKVTAFALNIRQGAGVKHRIIGWAHRGDQVKILGQAGNWLQVETEKGRMGFVHSRWIKRY